MSKWYDPIVLDKGLEHVATNANEMRLLKAYSPGDTYATVTATNSVVTIATTSGDFTLGDQGVNGRQQTVVAKAGTASANSGATPNLHIALIDTVNSKVLVVTDETSDQQIYSGNPINIPTFNIKMNQPT